MTDVSTGTLTEFLLERIAEEEAVARAATPGPWRYTPGEDCIESEHAHPQSVATGYPSVYVAQTSYDDQSGTVYNSTADGEHIARHDPARVLAECEAKRQIVELCGDPIACDQCGCALPLHDDTCGGYPGDHQRTLELLALPYADHPDYRNEFRP